MANDRFTDQMQAYGRWRAELIESIGNYQQWLEANGMSSPEIDLRIFELLQSLSHDRLTIAFVAEFARGKTELINAIFFSEYDRRLLPSDAGRTTMCPTELFYDNDADQAYIRLLPIETRLGDTSIAEHKLNPIDWTSIDLDTSSPDNMAHAFREVIRTKKVTVDRARELGLFDDSQTPRGVAVSHVEIPMWRHALISFPHPLLKQGLCILDTPGLNALGTEPELTLNMLPSAQAVVFMLAADTGVTKSDLDIWHHHVHGMGTTGEKDHIVVLNKIDTLWDELKDEESVTNTIANQCRTTAELLGIDPASVHPVSAQKGLIAKIRRDAALLDKSRILALESILAKDILPRKQSIVRDNIVSEIGSMAETSRRLVATRLQAAQRQYDELRNLSGKNEDVILHLMKKTREEQVTYHKSLESFQANRKIFSEQHKRLLEIMSITELDKLITETRKVMTDSWTTLGMKTGMKTFFDGVAERMKQIAKQVDQVNMLVQTVYRKFHLEHGLTDAKPRFFSVTKYKREMERLYAEAEAFRKSPVTTMTEQGFVVKKFFISMVSHARNVFFNASHEAESWGKSALAPLVTQIKEQKDQIEKRLESLRRINESRDTLQARLGELEKISTALGKQLADLDGLLQTLHRPLDLMPEAPAGDGDVRAAM